MVVNTLFSFWILRIFSTLPSLSVLGSMDLFGERAAGIKSGARGDRAVAKRQACAHKKVVRHFTTKKAITMPVAMVMTEELLPTDHICPTRFIVDPSL